MSALRPKSASERNDPLRAFVSAEIQGSKNNEGEQESLLPFVFRSLLQSTNWDWAQHRAGTVDAARHQRRKPLGGYRDTQRVEDELDGIDDGRVIGASEEETYHVILFIQHG
jgi:hypothetical protein